MNTSMHVLFLIVIPMVLAFFIFLIMGKFLFDGAFEFYDYFVSGSSEISAKEYAEIKELAAQNDEYKNPAARILKDKGRISRRDFQRIKSKVRNIKQESELNSARQDLTKFLERREY